MMENARKRCEQMKNKQNWTAWDDKKSSIELYPKKQINIHWKKIRTLNYINKLLNDWTHKYSRNVCKLIKWNKKKMLM